MKKKELTPFIYTDNALAVLEDGRVDATPDYRLLVSMECERTDTGIILRLGLPESLRDRALTVLATLVSASGSVYYSSFVDGRCEISVPSPCLWWPRGLGIQNLYRLCVSVYSGNEHKESLEYSIPLRTLSFDEAGRVCVNGVSFFCSAAVYDRLDRTHPDDLDSLRTSLIAIRDAGFNAVALKSGELMPIGFDELCDEYGLVVLPTSLCPDFAVAGEYGFAYYPRECENILSPEAVATYGSVDKAHRLLLDSVEEYSYPTGTAQLSYASSLKKGEALREAIVRARISGECPGILCYSFGEREAALSSSLLSHTLKRGPAYYTVRRALCPTSSVIKLEGNSIELFVYNEGHSRFVGEINLMLNDSGNYTLFSLSLPIICEPFSTSRVFERDFSDYTKDRRKDVYLYCSLSEGQSVMQECIQLFTKHREFAFRKPNISCFVTGVYPDLYLTVSSDSFARGVMLEFDGVDASVTDNCLDFTSNAPIRLSISCSEKLTAEELLSAVRIRTVYDIGK